MKKIDVEGSMEFPWRVTIQETIEWVFRLPGRQGAASSKWVAEKIEALLISAQNIAIPAQAEVVTESVGDEAFYEHVADSSSKNRLLEFISAQRDLDHISVEFDLKCQYKNESGGFDLCLLKGGAEITFFIKRSKEEVRELSIHFLLFTDIFSPYNRFGRYGEKLNVETALVNTPMLSDFLKRMESELKYQFESCSEGYPEYRHLVYFGDPDEIPEWEKTVSEFSN
jgi:hypothetical protein